MLVGMHDVDVDLQLTSPGLTNLEFLVMDYPSIRLTVHVLNVILEDEIVVFVYS